MKAPEVYTLWVDSVKARNDHEIWRSKKVIRQPYLLASLGQWLGLTAVLGVLALAAYALFLGHTTVAGILGVVDVIGLAAVFNGNTQNRNRRQDP